MRNCQEGACGTAGLLAALFPTLKRAYGHSNSRGITWSQLTRAHGAQNMSRRSPRVRVGRQIIWHRSDPVQPPPLSAASRTHDGQASSPCLFPVCSACREDSPLAIASVVCACGSCHCPSSRRTSRLKRAVTRHFEAVVRQTAHSDGSPPRLVCQKSSTSIVSSDSR